MGKPRTDTDACLDAGEIKEPALSRQLAALEEELGTKLFQRSGHGITLTDEGLLLKRRALEIADLEDRILDEFKENAGEVEGIVTIGGQFLEPVNTENLEYIRITDNDHWVISMPPDDPLVQKAFIITDRK